MDIKTKDISDFLTPIFASIGYGVSTTEYLQKIFLILTIISLSISILSRIIVGVYNLYKKAKTSLEDGKLTKDELDDIALSALQEYEAIKGSEEVRELQDIIKNKE
jgi:hypothetical protein